MLALATGPVGRVAVSGAKPGLVPGRRTRCVPARPRRKVSVTRPSLLDAPRTTSRLCASSSSAFPDPLGLNDPIEARVLRNQGRGLSPDLVPVLPEHRTWSSLDFLGLWIGLVVCVPAWRFAASFATLGATAAQAFVCVFLANIIVLVPMVASAQIGTKYGAPFPIIARAAFGVKGSRVPVFLRALVGCGWFGIQTHVGGAAVKALACLALGSSDSEALVPGALETWATFGVTSQSTPLLASYVRGATPLDLLCYLFFLFVQLAVVRRGVESIKTAERIAAPFLCILTLAMFGWAWQLGGGTIAGTFGANVAAASGGGAAAAAAAAAASEAFASKHFFPALSAVVGFWATMALNISDFSRFSRTQKDQALGQAFGLVGFMTLFSLVAVAVTTVASGAEAVVGAGAGANIDVGDPAALLGSAAFGGGAKMVAALGLIAATLSTNVAANVVAPANAFVALFGRRSEDVEPRSDGLGSNSSSRSGKESLNRNARGGLSFESAAWLVAAAGTAVGPWRLLRDARGFVWVWLVGHAALLAPVAGVILADYHLVRRRKLDLDGLYADAAPRGAEAGARAYWYGDGTNARALVAFAFGACFCLPGFLRACGSELRFLGPSAARFFASCYEHAWFVGFASAFVAHASLSVFARRRARRKEDASLED